MKRAGPGLYQGPNGVLVRRLSRTRWRVEHPDGRHAPHLCRSLEEAGRLVHRIIAWLPAGEPSAEPIDRRGGAREGADRHPCHETEESLGQQAMTYLTDAQKRWLTKQPGSESEVIRRLVEQAMERDPT